MSMTTTAAQSFYRTAKGSHRHISFQCANFRRSISLGDVVEIPAGEVKDWAPCDVCCDGHEVIEHAAKVAAKADAMCGNEGVTHPKRIQSNCRTCGKLGKVDRRTGSLRAHKPQN